MVKTATKAQANHKTVKPVFATYAAPLQTDIPLELEEYFENQGFSLRWVRIVNPETEGVDVKNIAKKRRYGWEPVTHKELSSIGMPGVSETFETGSDPKTKDYIVVGDVALFKRQTELSEEQKNYNEGEAWRQINDIKRSMGDLRQHGIQASMKSTFKQRNTSFGQTVGDAALDSGDDE